MKTNKLKLNADKTEFLLIGIERQRSNTSLCFPLSLLVSKLTQKKLHKIFEYYLTKTSNSVRIYQQCAAHAFTICGICGVSTVTLIWIVENCTSLLYGITDMDVTKLQRVQNRLPRIVAKSLPFIHNVPLLRFLHWLPVKFRLVFKISLLTYKTIHEKQSVYLHSMLAALLPSHSLRSNKGISLSVPIVKTNSGARAFHSCAPSLWSNLPLSVPSAISLGAFKTHLKTDLFDLAFPP